MSRSVDSETRISPASAHAHTARLVVGVGLAMESLSSPGPDRERLQSAIRCLGEHSGLGRASIYRYNSKHFGTSLDFSLLAEWRRNGQQTEGLRAPLPLLPHENSQSSSKATSRLPSPEAMANLHALLNQDVQVSGEDAPALMDSRDDVGGHESDYRSVIAIPLQSNDQQLGFLRFDHFGQTFFWSADDDRILRAFAGLLTYCLLQEQAKPQLPAFSIEQLALLKEIAFQLTESGTWSFLSPAWDHLTGIPATRGVGRHHSSWLFRGISEDGTATEPLDLTQDLAPGATRSGEAFLLADDHSLINVSFLITRVSSPSSGDGTFEGLLIDIREQKEQERRDRESASALESKNAQLLEALVAAREATRMKSEFLATMSHEIRTPLNGVIGMTTLMLGTSLDRKQREFAEAIRSSAESLLAIVNSILDFSRLEAQRAEVEQVEFNPRLLLDEVFTSVGELAARKRIELVSQIRYPFPANVVGDAGKLKQILINLTGNAIKFSPRGEVCIRMFWDFLVRPLGELHVHVIDRGIGISPDSLPRLFRPFGQADASTSRVYGGTGLGLAISKQLCDLMGGELNVQSRVGHGSEFRLVLRLNLPELQDLQPPVEPWASVLRDKRIMLANMGDLADQSWRSALHLAGISAISAEGMKNTTELLAAEDPDDCTEVVIFDTRGLEGSAAEINRQLRLAARHPDLALILLDSFHDPVDRNVPGSVAPILVLRKPISPFKAMAQVSSLIRSVQPLPRMPLRRVMEVPARDTHSPAIGVTLGATKTRGRTLSFLLKQSGLRTRTAESFQDLVRFTSDEPCHLILLDAELGSPGRNGIAERLRECGGDHLPLLIGAAFSESGQRVLHASNAFDHKLTLGFQRCDLQRVLSQFTAVPASLHANAS